MTYGYDELGNLGHVRLASGIEIDHLIDGLSRRLGKHVNGLQSQGFLYQNLLAPAAEAGAPRAPRWT